MCNNNDNNYKNVNPKITLSCHKEKTFDACDGKTFDACGGKKSNQNSSKALLYAILLCIFSHSHNCLLTAEERRFRYIIIKS